MGNSPGNQHSSRMWLMEIIIRQLNKLSLVGMQLPEEYKENFDVSSEGPSSGL